MAENNLLNFDPAQTVTLNTSLQTFSFDNTRVRIVVLDNDTWFIARDVACALGYSDAKRAVYQHCEDSINLKSLMDKGGDSPPFNEIKDLHPQTVLIPESDLYNLVIASRLPNAKGFKRWVTKDVLPSIRKTGSYAVAPVPAPATPAELLLGMAQTLVAQERKLVDVDSRVAALEDQRASNSVHFKEAPLGWNIKSRQIARLRKGMTIERGRRVRVADAFYEHIFDAYHDELFTGRTCDNPNPTVPGNRPCALYDDKTVNDMVRRVLTRARRLSDGMYEHKAIPHTFKIFEITD